MYYRVFDLTENLIKAFKVRDATVTVDHTAQRTNTRAVRIDRRSSARLALPQGHDCYLSPIDIILNKV